MLLNALKMTDPNWQLVRDFGMFQHDVVFMGEYLGRRPVLHHPQVLAALLNTRNVPAEFVNIALTCRLRYFGVLRWTWDFDLDYWPLALEMEPALPDPVLADYRPARCARGEFDEKVVALLKRLLRTQSMAGADGSVIQNVISHDLGPDLLEGSRAELWTDAVEKMVHFKSQVKDGALFVPLGVVMMSLDALWTPMMFPYSTPRVYMARGDRHVEQTPLFPLLREVDYALFGRRGFSEDSPAPYAFLFNFLRLGFVPSEHEVSKVHYFQRDAELALNMSALGLFPAANGSFFTNSIRNARGAAEAAENFLHNYHAQAFD